MNWQLAEAKNKLSELFQRALSEGPQEITRRGKERVVVLSGEEYERLKGNQPSFKEHLLNAPSFEGLDIERDGDTGREVQM